MEVGVVDGEATAVVGADSVGVGGVARSVVGAAEATVVGAEAPTVGWAPLSEPAEQPAATRTPIPSQMNLMRRDANEHRAPMALPTHVGSAA